MAWRARTWPPQVIAGCAGSCCLLHLQDFGAPPASAMRAADETISSRPALARHHDMAAWTVSVLASWTVRLCLLYTNTW